VFSGHPVPFRDIRAHMLYWMEFQFGTKFAEKKAKILHQKEIEACAPKSRSASQPHWTVLASFVEIALPVKCIHYALPDALTEVICPLVVHSQILSASIQRRLKKSATLRRRSIPRALRLT
jgi:hypothetical protein